MDLTVSADRIPLRLLPQSPKSLTKLWLLLPMMLLLVLTSVAFLRPCSLTPFFPFVALGGWGLCYRFRIAGLALASAVLAGLALLVFRHLPVEMRLWQMGVMLSFSLDFTLAFLCFEEVDALEEKREQHVLNTQKELAEVKEKGREEKEALETELKKWKEEAQQRRLDMRADAEKLALVQTEIESLTAQKEELISEAFEARKLASERLNRLGTQIEQTERVASLSGPTDEDLRRKCAQAEGLYKQLREQFEQKVQLLEETRKELFAAQTKLEAIEKDASEAELSGTLAQEVDRLTKENTVLQEEITALEGLVSRVLNP